MARSLSSVRRQVDRLAAAVEREAKAACPECRGQEAPDRLYWDAVPADAPAIETCGACGRDREVNHTVISWLP